MDAPTGSRPDADTRLDRLERHQRQLRRAAFAALCLLPLGLGAFALDSASPTVKNRAR